jgi:hypothetical protein
MKLMAHVMRADLRQFRLAILVWVLLVTAEAVLTGVRPTMGDVRAYGNVGMILNLLWFARQVAMLLLVPLVVQAHPAVGTDAFWMTRPIPPQILFASKAVLLAALTVVIPCAATFVLMRWSHVPVREALLVVLDNAIWQAAWLAVLVAGAAVTLNLARFALLCGAVFLSFVLFVAMLFMRARTDDAYGVATLSLGAGQPVLPPAEDPTAGILFLLCVSGAGLGLAALQYRTRLRRVSVPAGVGGMVLLAVAIPYWPFHWLEVPSALPPWARGPAAAQVHAASPVIELTAARGGMIEGAPAVRSGGTRVIVSGLEPGWMPRLQLRGAAFTLDTGATLVSRGRGFQSVPQIEGSPEYPSRAVAREVLRVGHVLMSEPLATDPAAMLALAANEIDPVLPATGRYVGQFAVSLTHWEAAAALPLRAGAVFQDEAYRFAIERVDAGPDAAVLVRAREWRATSSFDRKPPVAYGFYVRNAPHTQAMAGTESEPFQGMGAVSAGLPFMMYGGAGLSAFFVRTAFVSFPQSYGLQEQKIEWDPAWNAEAELVIVRMTDAGAVVRTLDMPRASVVVKR